MVKLQIKRGDENQFIYETNLNKNITELSLELLAIFNGRLKITRICYEMEELVKHGPMYPPEILGLTQEQVEELKLVDVWEDQCVPSGGWQLNKDPIGRRNGRQPKDDMQNVLKKTIEEAKQMVSKKMVDQNKTMTFKNVQNALDILRGAVTIVYPMQLPPHDPIRMEFTNTEDLAGTQASLEIIEPAKIQLWFAGRHMNPDKELKDYLGLNDKSKVIIKLVKCNEGPPGREPVLSEADRRQMMAYQYRRQEELKKLDENDDDQYLNARWADNNALKKQMHGLENVKFRSSLP